MTLMPRVSSHVIQTNRLRMHYLEAGPADGIPVIMIHGNLSTGRFFEHVLSDAPERYRLIAPDMRGFGDTEPLPVDGSHGLRDWDEDTFSLVQALGIERPVHLAGWSTGGAAVASYAIDRPVASLTFIDPVSPYGFGGTLADGGSCYPDYAGTGGGIGSPDFRDRLAAGDRGTDSPFSPRNVMRASYWSSNFQLPAEREDILVDEVLKSVTGEEGYPGDFTTSNNWPGVAPGRWGILNALSGKNCNWAGIVDINPKPPILWTHGTNDIVVADGSAWEMGTLGKMGAVPGWPSEDVFPPQPMISQIRSVLEQYQAAGGRVEMVMFEGSGHFPPIDAAERWHSVFFDFLASIE